MKTNSVFSLVIGIAALLVAGTGLWIALRTEQVYVIDNKAVFEGFELTATYETKLQQLSEAQLRMLDSLDQRILSLRKASSEGSPSTAMKQEIEAAIAIYQATDRRYQQGIAKARDQFNQQIWERLQPLLSQFANANHYDFLLGRGGMDDLYHFPASKDVTLDAISYINKHYSDERTP